MTADKKQPHRPLFIKEWAEARGWTRAEVARQIGTDKSVISRWWTGTSPGVEYQARLCELFKCERDSLVRHPDEDWLAKFMRGRSKEEIERIKATLNPAFPW